MQKQHRTYEHQQGDPRKQTPVTCGERPKIDAGGGKGIQYLLSLLWPVVQLDFSNGMHMAEKSYICLRARACAISVTPESQSK